MKRNITVLLFLLLLTTGLWAAAPGDIEIPGWSLSDRVLLFEKKGLYDYIDGGAELFLEFGFEDLRVYSWKKGQEEITLEIYHMECPTAAEGIYLMKCGKETPAGDIDARNSGDRYQILVLKGCYFIMVNNFSGSEAHVPALKAIARAAVRDIEGSPSSSLFTYLPEEHLLKGSQLLIRGPSSLQHVFLFGQGDILQLQGRIFGVTGDYLSDDGSVYTQIIIPYPSSPLARSAWQNLVTHLDPCVKVLKKRDGGFLFSDYEGKFGTAEIEDTLLRFRVKMAEAPEDTAGERKK